MSYNPKKEWEKALSGDLQSNNFPAQGLIRLFRGSYPLLTKIVESGKVLDLGCGDGRNTKFLQEEGYEVIGIEISENTIFDLNNRYPEIQFLTGTSNSIPLTDNSIDLLVAWNSIYYMGDLHNKIESHFMEARRVLRKNGNSRLILSIPKPTNFIFENSKILSKDENVSYHKIMNDPFNVRNGEVMAVFPTLQNLKAILEKFGFKLFETGEETGNWFGRQYDWWIIVASIDIS